MPNQESAKHNRTPVEQSPAIKPAAARSAAAVAHVQSPVVPGAQRAAARREPVDQSPALD